MNIMTISKKLLSLFFVNFTINQACFAETEDPFLWLEEVESARALEWVENNNAHTLKYLTDKPLFGKHYKNSLEIYSSNKRIPHVKQMGNYFYNFWRDKKHIRGIWRRTSLDEYKTNIPKWETVLDLDTLAKQESENWVYKDSNCLYPNYDRCLLELSRGGSDATIIREFDTTTKSFIKNGFILPEAKSSIDWIDKDTLFVSTNFGTDSMNNSGYPRIVKQWRRGQDIKQAKTIFEGEKSSVWVGGYAIHDDDKQYKIIFNRISFYASDRYLLINGSLKKLNIPQNSSLKGISNGQLLLELKTDWKVIDKVYPQASLLSINVNDLLAGSTNYKTILLPDENTSISSISLTKDHLLVNTLQDVSSSLYRYQYSNNRWLREKITMPEFGTISVAGVSAEHNNFFINYSNALTPNRLYYFDEASGQSTLLKSLPAFFNPKPYKIEQHFITAKDGVQVPYFLIMNKNTKLNGQNPTLLTAYGGFQLSLTPRYIATVGANWLEHGGVYVVANIRGGGEYGPDWHQAAIKNKRHIAFTDFISIAEDLIKRNITSTQHLGISGGSNGGLLVGAVVTMRPDLFNAVVCSAPLLDMKRYSKLFSGASWIAEYGDPDKEDEWNYIKQYSPYHNVFKDEKYPRIFFRTSTKDDRVHPAHARKMVAKMQAQGHDILYYENTGGGHRGTSNSKEDANASALIYTYLIDQLH